MTDLRCCSAEDLIASLAPGSVDAVIADPPWSFDSARCGATGISGADANYQTTSCEQIARALSDTSALCGPDAYLVVWCCWPKVGEWFASNPLRGWEFLSGGAWGKSGSHGHGMGYHFRGRSEPVFLYRKGRPRPHGGPGPNLWLHPRLGHSEKPPNALGEMADKFCKPGGLILDPFAGESASLARCCARLGRRYVGAEIDPERHQRALRRLAGESAAQSRMVGQESMFGGAS